MKVTERELMNVMERHGIARLDPKGERFDPNKHQAMFEVDDKDVAEGTIVEVVQAGYVIADRILRPAMVGIAKGGGKQKRSEKAAPDTAPQAANDDTAEGEAEPETKGEEPKEPKKGGKDQKKKVGGKVDKIA
jgi:molecular chaperone GrpE